MNIPDPIEQMEDRIERNAASQRGVPADSFRCQNCEQVFKVGADGPQTTSPDPSAPIFCTSCESVVLEGARKARQIDAAAQSRIAPPPWIYEDNGYVAYDRPDNKDANGHGVPVCRVLVQEHLVEGTGRLIAAAPEMLEALREAKCAIEVGYPGEYAEDLAYRQVCRAIREATGGQP